MVDLEIFDRVWNGEFFLDTIEIEWIVLLYILLYWILCCIVNYDGLSFSWVYLISKGVIKI